LRLEAAFWLACPSRIAVGLPQLILKVFQPLLQLINLLLFGVDFRGLVIDILAGVLFGQRFLWVWVVFHLGLLQFALQDIEFLLSPANLIVLVLEPLSPGGFAVRIVGFGA